ncbi:MAG: glycine/betaine/sarcosine/D-proline family reductase selenoprotein B [Candidatus Rokubacteria bacterium]|nr:glycine/betaine/sarcosine/D-proline family reductase selenoprotein B [Candidatus Rokubacteria bacterium]
MSAVRVAHYLNQFFGGVGGEDKADTPPELRPGAVGPGTLLQQLLGAAAQIVGTVICGDNRVAERETETVPEIVDLLRGLRPDVVVAGPAFNAGRYGLACAAVSSAARRDLRVPALTAMFAENPGREAIDRSVLVAVAGATAVGMKADLERLACLTMKTVRGEALGPADVEGYHPTGRRVNEFGDRTGAERMVDMLVKKLRREPYVSELVVPAFDRVPPAPPVKDLRDITLGVVTTSGIVRAGNPDGIESWRATRWARYSLAGVDRLAPEAFTCVHGGYDNRYIRQDPHRAMPLDVLRRYLADRRLGRLHETLYTTVGNVMPVERARRLGREIAQELRDAAVQAVLFTAT